MLSLEFRGSFQAKDQLRSLVSVVALLCSLPGFP